MVNRIPPAQSSGHSCAFDIEHLVRCRETAKLSDYDWSERLVMGLPLPSWQRPYEWNMRQQERFIESLYLNWYKGVYVVNSADYEGDQAEYRKFSNALLDGQQRITTVERYLDNAFPVFGAYWSELSKREQRRFYRTAFPCVQVNIWDETELRELSDLLSFGGTAHKDEYRASLGYNYKEEVRS